MRIKPNKMSYYYANILYEDEARKIRNLCFQNNIKIIDMSVAGSLRRRRKKIGDIDYVINTDNNKLLKELMVENLHYYPKQCKAFYKKRIDVYNVDVFIADDFDYYSMLFFLTGTEDWNLKIMRHLSCNTDILYTPFMFLNKKKEKLIFSSEKEIFNTIRIEYVEPCFRTPNNIKFIESKNEKVK